MNKKTAIIFPGQGAQYPGMGKDFYDQNEAAKAIFDRADELLGEKFSQKIFESTVEELSQTNVAQLAIYITSAAIYHALLEEYPDMTPYCMGGLSLGEYTALTASCRLSFEEGIKLVKARGEYMQQAADENPGTMAALLGVDEKTVEEAIKPFQEQGVKLWIANLNCPGQVVIAGEKAAITVAEPVLKDRGAKRIIFLDVAGAFHTPLMQSAQDKLSSEILSANFHESDIQFVSNVTGGFLEEMDEIKKNLISQVSSPVRWESDIRAMESEGVELFIEVGCGRTLSGMNRKIKLDVPTINVDKVEDLEKLKTTLVEMV
ncbi:MAG: ACP S-malonyltransferase [Rhabdochlamydiaceae bacterium]|nr:ACP S-malonyltransferase [Candidatus Amphrikana amoebophyrae]